MCADFISYDLINVLFVKYYKYEGYAVAYRDCGITGLTRHRSREGETYNVFAIDVDTAARIAIVAGR